MPWATSDRRSRLPKNWTTLRAAILTRDRWLCQVRDDGCQRLATEVDHITPGDDHSPTNLQAICVPCHAAKTAREATEARRTIAAHRLRPTEPHPGLL